MLKSVMMLCGVLVAGEAWAAPIQSKASFEAAFGFQDGQKVQPMTTSPRYVLIDVVDKGSSTKKTLCITANLLIGAIMKEYGPQVDPLRFAVANTSHEFEFSQPAALTNLPQYYTDDDVATMRRALASYSVAELKTGFASTGQLQSLYIRSGQHWSAHRDAIACVLLERGLSPVMGDRSGQVFIEQ